MDKNMQIF